MILVLIACLTYTAFGAGGSDPSFYQGVDFTLFIDSAYDMTNTYATDAYSIASAVKTTIAALQSDTSMRAEDLQVKTTGTLGSGVHYVEYCLTYATSRDDAEGWVTSINTDLAQLCTDINTAGSSITGFDTTQGGGAACLSVDSTGVSPIAYFKKRQVLTWTFSYTNITEAEVILNETEFLSAISTPLNPLGATLMSTHSHPQYMFELRYDELADAQAMETKLNDGATYCPAVDALFQAVAPIENATAGSGTGADDCVSAVTITLTTFDDDLDSTCTSGEYAVDGLNIGVSTIMDYDNSSVSLHPTANDSVLTVQFLVPSMYFFVDQTLGTESYNRSIAITFHDRTDVNADTFDSECYTTRPDYANCPQVEATWYHSDEPDNCMQRLVGELDFQKMLFEASADPDFIRVQNATRTVNGFTTPTWELYMVAFVETWAGVIQVGNNSGIGNIYNNNPDSVVTDWTNHLTINRERPSFYHIPFHVSWPQEITIVAEPIISHAAFLSLYALITQQVLNINFSPGDNVFGLVDIVITTQTQWPFGLRNDTDEYAPALQRITTGVLPGHTDGPATFEFHPTMESDDICNATQIGEFMYCVQEWPFRITPTTCDVSADYQLEFWGKCFNMTQCPLDELLKNESLAIRRTSNAWSGYLDFTIESQNFCPQVIDDVFVEGRIRKYIDVNFTEAALPGSNLFSNDHVYFEVTFLTSSTKTNLHDGNSSNTGNFVYDHRDDDSLIDFVRATKVSLEVDFGSDALPLQQLLLFRTGSCAAGALTPEGCDVVGTTAVTCDPTATEVVGGTPPCMQKYYITLCEVAEDDYDYTDPLDDCFAWANKGWMARDYLAFTRWTSDNVTGPNTMDQNEIAFSLRLDERTIPVDVANGAVDLTLGVDVEVYYHGIDTPAPVRRTLRRKLQEGADPTTLPNERNQMSHSEDTFQLTSRHNTVSYCVLKNELIYTGFELEIVEDTMNLPTEHTAPNDIVALKYAIAKDLGVAWTTLEIYQVDGCHDGNCQTIFPNGRRRLAQYARWYIDVKDKSVARQMQLALMDRTSSVYSNGFMAGKALRAMYVDHCVSRVATIMNRYRTPSDFTQPEAVESSVASFAVVLSFVLMAFFY